MTVMRRSTVAMLTALTVIAVLLSAVACDRAPSVTEEPTVQISPTATQEPTATPEVVVEVHKGRGAPSAGNAEANASSILPCGKYLFGIWGDRGRAVGWSTRLSGDEIVFSAGPELYAVRTDGRGLRMISEPADERGAEGTTAFDVSPDGTQVALSTCDPVAAWLNEGEQPDLFDYEHELAVASLDGGQVRRLTANQHFDNYPSWSPDGSRIAYVSSGETPGVKHEWNDVDLHSMAADGTDVRRIARGPLVHHPPQWSPDGERIAYVKFDGRGFYPDPAIYVVGASGADPQRLTDAASGPSWSPDGLRIAFAKADGEELALYTIAADGTDARRLAVIESWWHPGYEKPEPARAWIPKVSWSPDGSKILVRVPRRSSSVQIVAADGSGTVILTVRNPFPDSVDDAAWSPDGTRIAMTGVFRALGRRQTYDPTAQIALVTIAADGSDTRMLVGRRADSMLSRDRTLVGLGVERGDISAEVAACGEGVVVPDPEANPGLVEDCEALLEVENSLAGPGGLNWHVDRSIGEWEGIVVGGSPMRVREIVLRSRSLGGEIPTELSRLTELRVLDMSDNGLTGEIPAELGESENLERLDLSRNYLSGEMPAELGELSILTFLSLEANSLEGEIPPELRQLTDLERLLLNHNQFTGCIPGGLRSLFRNNDPRNLDLPDCE